MLRIRVPDWMRSKPSGDGPYSHPACSDVMQVTDRVPHYKIVAVENGFMVIRFEPHHKNPPRVFYRPSAASVADFLLTRLTAERLQEGTTK